MSPRPDPAADASPVEKADVAVAQAAAGVRHHPVTRALGFLSDAGDQPPLFFLSGAVLAAGFLSRRPHLVEAGARMLAAETVATLAKSAVKKRVSRTRPRMMLREQRYEMRRGGPDEGDWNSFPSGHTAGAVAVSRAFARVYPERAVPAYLAAGAVAVIQIPRCAHYPTDIAAGAIVGWASEWLVDRVAGLLQPGVDFPR